ncbi:MAG: hypothetical protein ABSE15_00440 [Candidatus Bathyarchaeia archaeon]
MKNSLKKALAAAAIILIAASLVVTIVEDPGLFHLPSSLSLVSLSQITVDPQGASVGSNGALTGVYWNLLGAVDSADVMQGFLLPNGTAAATTVAGINQEVTNTASVEVDITPLQPYFIRDLQVQQMTYAPAAQGSTGSTPASAATTTYYAWNGPWEVYTPYQVTVKQNGNVIGTATLNTQGNSGNAQTIQTNDGDILIDNLGGLTGIYAGPPDLPSQICILNNNYVYDWGVIQSYIDCTTPGPVAGANAKIYSDYWYGTARTSANVAYDPTIISPTFGIGNVYLPSQYGGWEGSDSGGNVSPVQPVLYSSDKGTLPSDKRSFLSLTEWLQSQDISNLAAYGSGVLSEYPNYQLVTDTNGEAALQVDIPWGAYATPLVNIRIPVEMADTFVERPQISDVAVDGYWQRNGEKTLLNIGAQATLEVDLTQKSSVTSSALITVNSTDPRAEIYPSQTTETLAPGATQTIEFTVAQAGGSQPDGTAANPIAINIDSYETYSGTLMEHDTVYCTFAATVGSSLTTTLSIHVQDNSTAHSPIVAEALNLEWPPSNGQTLTAYTDSDGNAVVTLSTSAGGGYSGQVQIDAAAIAATAKTPAYPAQYITDTVNPGPNSLTITMGSTPNKAGTNWILIAIIIGLIAAVIAVVAVLAYAMKHAKKRRR